MGECDGVWCSQASEPGHPAFLLLPKRKVMLCDVRHDTTHLLPAKQFPKLCTIYEGSCSP